MSEFSPQTQAAWDAAYNTPEDCPYEHDLAAALEAVADQVVLFIDELHTDHMRKRNQLLAIAAELRGTNTTTQENN